MLEFDEYLEEINTRYIRLSPKYEFEIENLTKAVEMFCLDLVIVMVLFLTSRSEFSFKNNNLYYTYGST